MSTPAAAAPPAPLRGSNEASVKALLSHMNSLETRRRMTMMQRKEQEATLAQLSKDHQAASLKLSDAKQQHLTATSQLTALSDRLQRLTAESNDAKSVLLGCASEESVLLQHTASAHAAAADSAQLWQQKQQQAAEACSTWAAVESHFAPSQDALAAVDADITAQQQEFDRLKGLTDALQQRVAAAASTNATLTPSLHDEAAAPSARAFAAAELLRLKEQTTAARRAMDDEAFTMSRAAANYQREIDDLQERADEMQGWLSEVRSSVAQLLGANQRLTAAQATHLCGACRPGE